MLITIPSRSWHQELTKELCSILTVFAKKREEILYCTNPVIFCVLVAEFMDRLSSSSL